MTWDEITKKYESEIKRQKPDPKLVKFGKNWGDLVKSTDKLVWLFSLSGSRTVIKNG